MRYCFSDYTLDLQRYELQRNGNVVPLRRKVFDLIVYLLSHRDQVVSRQELLDALWPDQIVSDGVLDSCLATARRALGDSGRRQQVIKTQHGRGYRFIAPVTTPVVISSDAALTEDLLASQFLLQDIDAVSASSLTTPDGAPVLPLQNGTSITGEHKPATVLVGMLHQPLIADALNVETQHERRRTIFNLVLDVAQRYGGTLDRLLDNGFLAWFGAPRAHEDHALRAVLAALDIQQCLQDDNSAAECDVTLRMGVHTGAVCGGGDW